MNVRPLTNSADLASVEPDWDRLAAGHPLRGFSWHSGWWRHYGPADGVANSSQALFVLAVSDASGRVVGIAPWRLEETLRSGAAIRWLGDGEVCTDHLTILCERQNETEVCAAIASHLVDDAPEWDLLDLTHVDQNDRAVGRLMQLLTEADCGVRARPADACWAVDLPSDWEAYLQLQSKSHRKQLRRLERRVLDSEDCRWHVVETSEDWRRAWPLFVELHQRRRLSLGEPGCFASAAFHDFHQQLSQEMLQRGQLRMSWLELRGRPVAAEYHFASGDTVFAYQGGLDPDALDEEPGRLSTIATLRAAMQQNLQAFDFMRGDESYKAHFRAQPRLCEHWRAVPPRLGAKLRDALERGVRSLSGR